MLKYIPTFLLATIVGIVCCESIVPDNNEDIRDSFRSCNLTLEAGFLAKEVYRINDTNVDQIFPISNDSIYSNSTWIDEGSTEVLVNLKSKNGVGEFHQGIPIGSRIVTFRGTEENLDWVVNIDQVKVRFGPSEERFVKYRMFQPTSDGTQVEELDILIHRGFGSSFQVYDRVAALLDELSGEASSTDIYVQGHSLGGANAQIFATYYSFMNPLSKVYVTTMGAPRVGNRGYKIFTENLKNLNQFRIVNLEDIFARVPYDDFHHAGHLIWRSNTTQGILSTKAYYRTLGNKKSNGLFSIAILKGVNLNNDTRADLISPHFMFNILPWLQEECSNGTFPVDFDKL